MFITQDFNYCYLHSVRSNVTWPVLEVDFMVIMVISFVMSNRFSLLSVLREDSSVFWLLRSLCTPPSSLYPFGGMLSRKQQVQHNRIVQMYMPSEYWRRTKQTSAHVVWATPCLDMERNSCFPVDYRNENAFYV